MAMAMSVAVVQKIDMISTIISMILILTNIGLYMNITMINIDVDN